MKFATLMTIFGRVGCGSIENFGDLDVGIFEW